ncbi:MAG: hypothetical protein OHK0015_51320 [Chloroflexi bacterium OHK40]
MPTLPHTTADADQTSAHRPVTVPFEGVALSALYDAARQLARASTVAEVERVLLAGAGALTGAPVTFVRLASDRPGLDTSAERLTPPAPGEGRTDMSDGMAGAAALNAPETATLAERLGVPVEQLSLTTVAGATPHGILVAVRPTAPAAWDAALAALAGDAGAALDRILQSEAQRSAALATMLGAIETVSDLGLLHSGLLERLLSVVLGQILDVGHLASGAIYLTAGPNEAPTLALWARGPAGAFGPDPASFWEGPAATLALAEATAAARLGPRMVAATGQDTNADRRLIEALQELEADALVTLPMQAGGWLTGVLQLLAVPERPLHQETTLVLRTLARQAAIAIENARLAGHARADQQRTRAVVDATNDAILVLDEQRRPMVVNRRARFFFGLTEHDLIGKGLEQLNGLFGRIFADGQRFSGWLRELLNSQSERAVEEFQIISPEPRLLQCYSAPVMDQQDHYLGRILVFRDITREREVERMKNDFVSTVSHELRTPLTSIRGALQLVLGQPDAGRPGMAAGLPAQGRDLLSISLTNTERLIRLINDILDIAKIEQGRIQLRRETLSAEELCRSAAAEVSAIAEGRDITVELRLPAGLPPVLADRDRSVQILVNLLSNAIKFSPPGQRVVISAHSEGSTVSFSIQDWGRGIAPEDQARIFQKFQQIDSSATRDVGGTGLGLAISKALVEEQGGRMWLETRPGHGSTFSFSLPAMIREDHGAEATAHVLVVDDDPYVRPVLVRLLQRHGLHVSAADDGYVALAAAAEQQPDLILLDLKMPGLGGLEVLRRLKARPETASIPVIILTANDLDEPARQQGRELGAQDYLEKPIAYERLIGAIDAVLNDGRDL